VVSNGFQTSAIGLAIGTLALTGLIAADPLGRDSIDSRAADRAQPPTADTQPTRDHPHARITASTTADDRDEHMPIQASRRTPPDADESETGVAGHLAAAPESELELDLAERLERAIRTAERERGLRIAPAVVNHVLDQGEARILFPVATDADVSTIEGLLDGSAPAEGAPGLRVFPLVGQAAAPVDAESLLALIASGATNDISLDRIHRPSLASTVPLITADVAHAAGDDGNGRVVAVLDTGVDLDHPMFLGRIVEEACFSLLGQCPNASTTMTGPGAAEACPSPGCGHGTSVAAIAVGRQPDDSLIGVAPAADLIAIRIFSDLGGRIGAYTSDIIAGLQHVLALSVTYPIDVVNLSFASSTYETVAACDASSPSTLATVALLRSAGIVTIASGGNDGLADAITSPACLSNVIGVGAIDNTDEVPGYSNSDDLLALLAPGVSIETASNGGGTSSVGGTSMAAPHASGGVALIRTHYPTATPSEIENALVLSGVPVYDPRGDVTLPRLDVQAAIDLLIATSTPPSPSPTPPSSQKDGPSTTSTASDGGDGGGGGACGLIGIEPFLVLAGIRIKRSLVG